MLRRSVPQRLLLVHGRPAYADLALNTAHLDVLGAPDWEDVITDWPHGLPPSPGRGWAFRADCGLELIVSQDWYRPDRVIDHAILAVSCDSEVEHALLHLPCAATVRERWPQRLDGGWRVSRMDDAGLTHEVGLFPLESSARCVAATLEARGHKQTYLVERHGEPPEWLDAPWLVRRQDDNGQVFTARAFQTRFNAEAWAQAMEREPQHKQLYWVERRDDSGRH